MKVGRNDQQIEPLHVSLMKILHLTYTQSRAYSPAMCSLHHSFICPNWCCCFNNCILYASIVIIRIRARAASIKVAVLLVIRIFWLYLFISLVQSSTLVKEKSGNGLSHFRHIEVATHKTATSWKMVRFVTARDPSNVTHNLTHC